MLCAICIHNPSVYPIHNSPGIAECPPKDIQRSQCNTGTSISSKRMHCETCYGSTVFTVWICLCLSAVICVHVYQYLWVCSLHYAVCVCVCGCVWVCVCLCVCVCLSVRCSLATRLLSSSLFHLLSNEISERFFLCSAANRSRAEPKLWRNAGSVEMSILRRPGVIRFTLDSLRKMFPEFSSLQKPGLDFSQIKPP